MSFSTSDRWSNRPLKPGGVAVAGNVLFPQWRRFSRLPDGFVSPGDATFVATMLVGLVLYFSVAAAALTCGMACYRLGQTARAWRSPAD
jgi:hypothetical protein